MMDPAGWEQANAAYVAAALAWLRARLEVVRKNAAPSAPEGESSPRPAESRRVPAGARRGAAAALAEAQHAPAPGPLEPPPALVTLARRFGLSAFEQDVLLLCVSMELDTGIASLCAQAQDDPQRRYPTFALALAAFDEPAWDVLSPDGPLRYWRMLDTLATGGTPMTASPLRADERIVHYVKGLNYLDVRLSELMSPIEHRALDKELPASQQSVAEAIFNSWKRQPDQLPPVAYVVGVDAASLERIAVEVATAVGRKLYRLPLDALPRAASDIEAIARLWQRESRLLPIALYIDAHDAEPGGESSPLIALRRFLLRAGGYTFVATRDVWPALESNGGVFDIAKPTAREQQLLWASLLGPESGDSPAALASQFDLGSSAIVRIGTCELGERSSEPLALRLWDRCRAEVRPRLEGLGRRIEARATWDDLILPEAQTEALHEIAAQVASRYLVYETWGFARKMNRGLGISALFCGESGVGKTLSAEVIANALRLNLYRIDLSSVVSKYIGETEKNLRRLFDAAEDGGAILFFDEADALFGKRSEVRDSHDRYANIEINYLLQRVESFRGLAILATNAKSALDAAFVRRLRFIVNFPHPAIAERKRMWQHVFPAETELEDFDADRLARLNLTGSAIHNAALNAAFSAARRKTPVTMALIVAAARAQYAKSDRPINEGDFTLQPAPFRAIV